MNVERPGLVCNVDITDVILPSDAEYQMAFHAKAVFYPGILSTHGPCLCCMQKGGENKCLVCSDLYGL